MEKSIYYGTKKIYFDLQHSERKTMGIKVTPDGHVWVKVPIATKDREVEEWVMKKAQWILKQQAFFAQSDFIDIHSEIKSGYSVLYMGRQYKLLVKIAPKDEVFYQGNLFLVHVKKKQDASKVFYQWMKHRAMQKIVEIAHPLMKKFLRKHSVSSEISFQEMPTRWGSCTGKNKLIFNPKLIHTPKRCIEYVVVHELCHLIHKHHNEAFFNLLTTEMPDWEKRKAVLDRYRVNEINYLCSFEKQK